MRQEQARTATARREQGVCDACRRENEGRTEGVATRAGPAMEHLSANVYFGEFDRYKYVNLLIFYRL